MPNIHGEGFVGQQLGMIVIACFLVVLVTYLAWYKDYFVLPSFNKKEKEVSFWHVLAAFLIIFIFNYIYGWFVKTVLVHWIPAYSTPIADGDSHIIGWINIFGFISSLILLLIYFHSLNDRVRRSIWGIGFVNLKLFLKNWMMGILTCLISYPFVFLLTSLSALIIYLFHLNIEEQVAIRYLKMAGAFTGLYSVTACVFTFVVPVMEELLFRGFLLNWLVRYCGRLWAVLLVSIVFAFFHYDLTQAWGNLELLPAMFILSCFLGFIYYRQESLWASIALHSSFNGINIIMMTFSNSV